METKPSAAKRPTTTSKPSSRRKNRPRRPSPSPSTTTTTTARTTTASRYQEYSTPNRVFSTSTTPAPPTTPDTGTDFKCEDEGFFPHPRDCKKYFWCLDSGPSELGIVAHQFTCPSGLFFNKLADSCDYTRNVLCSKPKSSTAKPTTSGTSTTPRTTTTRAPYRTTAAATPKRTIVPIRQLIRTKPTTTTTTTTTTTEAYLEEEYDDEEYDDADDANSSSQSGLDAEDPKVIKELIDLIKKVGGIEELEKQLKQNQDGSHVLYDPNQASSTLTITTTPPSIHKKLYEKILRKPIPSVVDAVKDLAVAQVIHTTESSSGSGGDDSGATKNQLPKYSSIYRATNSRPAPQNDGLDEFSESEGLRNEKPQYITITRNRPQTTPAAAVVDEELLDEEDEGSSSEDDISIARSTESTFVRYTIPEHVEVTGHDSSYRLSAGVTGGGFDGQSESSSTPYVTIYRTTTAAPSPAKSNGERTQSATSK